MLYNDMRRLLRVKEKYSFTYRSRTDGKLKKVDQAVLISIYHKKAMATFEHFNGVTRSHRLIAIRELNGERIYW